MKEAEVYNNGNGWRIAFSFQRATRVLTIEETLELIGILQRALEHVPAYVVEEMKA